MEYLVFCVFLVIVFNFINSPIGYSFEKDEKESWVDRIIYAREVAINSCKPFRLDEDEKCELRSRCDRNGNKTLAAERYIVQLDRLNANKYSGERLDIWSNYE